MNKINSFFILLCFNGLLSAMYVRKNTTPYEIDKIKVTKHATYDNDTNINSKELEIINTFIKAHQIDTCQHATLDIADSAFFAEDFKNRHPNTQSYTYFYVPDDSNVHDREHMRKSHCKTIHCIYKINTQLKLDEQS